MDLFIMKKQNDGNSVAIAPTAEGRDLLDKLTATTLLHCKLYLNYGQTKDCQEAFRLASLCFASFDFPVFDVKVTIKLMTA